jgi:Na+-transporting methylmalonyl-CoA/oxaloacetate decarboxylase gamma subunit
MTKPNLETLKHTIMIESTLLLVETGKRAAGNSADEFAKLDPTGVGLIIIALTIVFTVLITLYLAFRFIAKLYKVDFRKLFKRNHPGKEVPAQNEEISGETLAAISLALHLYHKEVSGMDDAIITIKNAARKYSPWSSKIYGLRKTPNQ